MACANEPAILVDRCRLHSGDLLAANTRVTSHLDRRQIAALLDPTAYTGLCAEMARDGALRARATARQISRE